ncbi:MAG: outer membrane protein assembly factor BamD [Kiritimatiellae bacterium]|nr:outer membrane protein assembly factor BamD [Kiritimatiellia bacterium]
MKRLALATAAAMLAAAVWAAPGARVPGTGMGGASPFATDHYPGFEDLDAFDKPERRTPSWFLGLEKDNAADQFAWAKRMEAEGSLRAARRGYDALVRQWPASPEAPQAQLALARLWETKLQEYDEAFDAYDYLLDFYPRACDYAEIVAEQYKIVNLLAKNKRTWFGLSFTSTRSLRRKYEHVVRRAPGAEYAADAFLKIADLREQDSDWEEAVKVYGAVQSRYDGTVQARTAAYLEAAARMHLARRLAYNNPRLKDTRGYLKLALQRYPDHERAEEMKGWIGEIDTWLSEEDWKSARFYDTRQRTRHAALSAYEKFVKEHPDSAHADEARARIDEINAARGAAAERK